MILVIDNYDSFTWNLVHYLRELGAEVRVARSGEITLPEAMASGAAAYLISPGPGVPDEAGVTLDLVAACAEAGRPLLGVCLGHQAIAQAFGGRIERAGAPMHGKTCAVTHDGTGLFAGLPSPFTAARYHSLVVAADSMPDCLRITGNRGGRHRAGTEPSHPPDPRRPVPPGERGERAWPRAAAQFPGMRRDTLKATSVARRVVPVAWSSTA
jgi:anthranilate synthase component 2